MFTLNELRYSSSVLPVSHRHHPNHQSPSTHRAQLPESCTLSVPPDHIHLGVHVWRWYRTVQYIHRLSSVMNVHTVCHPLIIPYQETNPTNSTVFALLWAKLSWAPAPWTRVHTTLYDVHCKLATRVNAGHYRASVSKLHAFQLPRREWSTCYKSGGISKFEGVQLSIGDTL